jgi:hypothetical protein
LNQSVGSHVSSVAQNYSYLATAKQPRPAAEVEAMQGSIQPLQRMEANLYDLQADALWTEVYRRVMNPRYISGEPGYAEAIDFRKRCQRRGVPIRAMSPKLAMVCATRTLGFGSPQYQAAIMDRLGQFAGAFDPVGRQNFVRDSVVYLSDSDTADRYLGEPDVDRVPEDDLTMAELEFRIMQNGQAVSVIPSQPHDIHAEAHDRQITGLLATRENPQTNPIQLEMQLQTIMQHQAMHLDLMGQNPVMASIHRQYIARYREQTKEAAAVVAAANSLRAIQDRARREQAAAQQEQFVDAVREEVARTGLEVQGDIAKQRIKSQGQLIAKREKNQGDLALKRDRQNQEIALRRSAGGNNGKTTSGRSR